MSFRINTNVNALNAKAVLTNTGESIKKGLERLGSGLRINKAADDASGMQIADSLRNQSNSLGQAIKNANDALGIIQIADKAMDEQLKIVQTIKVKATQAAQDGQTATTRAAIQADINRLIEGLDNIANTTSFNGQTLLSGQFTNKEFQIGAYSNTTVKTSIQSTNSTRVGHVRMETFGKTSAAGTLTNVQLTFHNVDGVNDYTLESIKISNSSGTGIGVLADTINKSADRLNAKANWSLQVTGKRAISAGSYSNITINGITIGTVSGVAANDTDGRLIAAINNVRDRTGIEATVDENGRLNLRSLDGRALRIGNDIAAISGNQSYVGRLTLIRLDARDIEMSGISAATGEASTNAASANVNLKDMTGSFNINVACAAGAFANGEIGNYWSDNNGIGVGVTTLKGAMLSMDIADSALKMLDGIKAELASSVYNRVTSTLNNITITQVNVAAAESQIRDVDFASESAEFSKTNVLMQSGNYALQQSNTTQQNIMRLLQ